MLLYTPNEKNRDSLRAFSCVCSSNISGWCSNIITNGHKYKYKLPLCFVLFHTGRRQFFKRVLFTVQNKVISTEFQPVNSVHSQWKWNANWTLWWINNEPHWNHLCCSPQSGICIITSLGSIFDNLLPQRNQIDWRGSHYCQVTHIQLVLSISQKTMWFAQIWNSSSLPGSRIPALNAWNNENANLVLISQMKFKP